MITATRLYRALIRLLPRDVRERDGDEMLTTFRDQLAATARPRALAWRAFRRFPLVLVLEWRDAIGATRDRAPRAAAPPPRATRGESAVRALRHGARSLRRTPAFASGVVLLLGLGIGSVTAMFAVVDHVLLRQLPYPAADRLFVVQNGAHSVPMFRDMVTSFTSADRWAAASTDPASLTGYGDPQRIREATVTEDFFAVFGARAELGRLLQPDDFRGAQTAVISWATWVRAFGGDSGVVGRTIRVDHDPVTVVGVLDRHFTAPEAIAAADVDVWRPLDPGADYIADRRYWAFGVVGRLRDGATLGQAEQDAARLAADRAVKFPAAYAEDGAAMALPVVSLQAATSGDARQGLGLIFGAVVLLLLVACANVTHLFLARGVARSREIAVRRALGASTGSLVSQLLTESLLLGGAGAVLGGAIAWAGVRTFLALMPAGLPRASAVSVDWRVLLFAVATGIVTAVLFGLLPSVRFIRGGIGDPLRGTGRGATSGRAAHTARNVIVIAEVALSLVLVAQAGWLLRSFVRLSGQEIGVRTAGVITMPMSLAAIATPAEWFTRMDAVRESLSRTPGVDAVAFGLTMPLEWSGGGRCCWGEFATFPGRPRPERPSMLHPVSDDYFTLLELPLIAGESWTHARATATPHPAVINEALATAVFGTPVAALGAAFSVGESRFEVVGVAANSRHYGASQPYGTAVYLPATALPYAPGRVHFAVRTERTDPQLYGDLRAAVWKTEPNVPVPTMRSMQDWSSAGTATQRFESALFATFSAIALVLVAAGLGGTLFYMVSLQRRDLGIRLALGATPGGVARRVLSHGTGIAAIGAVIGAVGAWLAGRLLEARLFGVEARDLRTLAVSMLVLMVIALVSSWVPARRAAATNPLESLRAE